MADEGRGADPSEPEAAAESDAARPAAELPVTDESGSGSARFASGGSMEFQDPLTTTPRPPTPAELRARDKYERQQRELEEAQRADEERARRRKRVMMGTVAAVGVVGVVAGLMYWTSSGPSESSTSAQCVRDDPDGHPVIVPDSYCGGYTPGLGGFFFLGGHQYRYYYGSSGGVGSPPMGGTTIPPERGTIKTKSGTSIQRGGLGGKIDGGAGS